MYLNGGHSKFINLKSINIGFNYTVIFNNLIDEKVRACGLLCDFDHRKDEGNGSHGSSDEYERLKMEVKVKNLLVKKIEKEKEMSALNKQILLVEEALYPQRSL